MKTYKLLDGSWAYLIKDGELCYPSGNICEGRTYALITECNELPANVYPLLGSKYRKIKNNAIIQDINSGEVFFSRMEFLSPRGECYCPTCGHKLP